MQLISIFLILILFISNTYSNNEITKLNYDNKIKEYGPITICSNNFIYNGNERLITYLGNVFIIQINNKQIICHKSNSVKKNVNYFLTDKNLSFKELQKQWLKQAKLLCLEEKKCNFISGQKLIIKLDKNKKIKTLIMFSEGSEKSHFYTFSDNLNSNSKIINKGPVEGSSQKIIYDVTKKHFIFDEKVSISQNKNIYKGERVIFDISKDLIFVPGSKNIRSNMILDGIENKLKINTGFAAPTLVKLPVINKDKIS